ncbi:hypothetical protein BDZ94DRAFT_1270249 [Collybia nuda]|uniref:F-box domain-containing protein n=1 Tax=Collybia nuda TaxID=64659 RepID=A0A9P5XXF3_9AGAR|nr:hypothetical protein BDZ94DRAFT_1270249 [Collybia nuda]
MKRIQADDIELDIERVKHDARTTNEVLSEEDTFLLSNLQAEAQRDISSLDNEISQVQEHITQLQDKLQALLNARQKKVEQSSWIQVGLAPQKKIPPEILAEIFLSCLDGQPTNVPPQSSSSEIPWVLCHVCSHWRVVAISDPRLWANINISSSEKVHKAAFCEVLSRSRNLRLVLDACQVESMPNIIDIILKHRERIQSLSLPIKFTNTSLTTKLSRFTKLTTLSLVYRHKSNNFPKPLSPFSLPTALQNLRITSNAPRYMDFRNVGLSLQSTAWAQLRSFQILSPIFINALDILVILGQCHMLSKCEIALETDLRVTLEYPQPITVPALKSITIYPEWFTLGPFLGSLVLPSLTDLVIGPNMQPKWPQDEVLALIQRSRCSLTSFTSRGCCVPSNLVLPLMRAMPDLTVLNIETSISRPIPYEVFNTIQVENLVPALEEIYLLIDNPKTVLDFLEGRWSEGKNKGIQRGTIYFRKEIEEDEGGVAKLQAAMVANDAHITIKFV